jgi:hypothetical protein
LHTTVNTDTLHLLELSDRTVFNVRVIGLCIVTQRSIETPHAYRN